MIPAAAAPPLHTVERMQGTWDAESAQEVLAHLSEMMLPTTMERAILTLHDVTGLPWWMTLVASTLVVRSCVLPFNILYLRNQLRVKLLRKDMEILDKEMQSQASAPAAKLAAAQRVQELFKIHKCHPLFSWDLAIPLAFPVFFLSYFLAVHNLALGDGGMATGGLLWFENLMAPDPTNLLPVVSAVTWLAVAELSATQYYMTSPRVRLSTRLGAIAMIPLTMTLPCGVFCFWITSNIWEVIRIKTMLRDDVRTLFGIPLLSELPKIKPVEW
jgi:YidC/Oxa1 family membrane protein insertase